MRSLTRAEAVVIQSLLASDAVTGREHIRRSGLPPRTFEVARKRVLDAGWVRERYIPNPILLGRPLLSVVLAHPYAEYFWDVARRWNQIDGNVLLWRGGTSVLGVFFRSTRNPSLKHSAELGDPETFSRIRAFETDARDSEIPAYFDFEGSWTRIVGEPGSRGYPHSLPDTNRATSRVTEANPSELRSMASVTRSTIDTDSETARGGMARNNLGRDEFLRALDYHLVTRRAFLGLDSLPGYRGWDLRQIAFLTGRLRQATEGRVMLQTLSSQTGLTPFLFVSDGVDVLSAFLSPNPRSYEGAGRSGQESVVGILQKFLQEIHVTREPADEIAVLVDHRYDRLFS